MNEALLSRYRTMRADYPGLSASIILRWARTPEPERFEWEERDGKLTARTEREGFDVVLRFAPDYDGDDSWIGKFVRDWEPGAIKNPRGWHSDFQVENNDYLAWWVPAQDPQDDYEWHHKAGYSKQAAREAAAAGLKELTERAFASDGYCQYGATVDVFRAGIELGNAGLWGIDLGSTPWKDYEHQADRAFADNDLIDEAINSAKDALANLCGATHALEGA